MREGYFSVVAFELEEEGAPYALNGVFTPGQVLCRELEVLLARFCRGSDIYCRDTGACRFLVLLHAADCDGAHIAAKRMLGRIEHFLAKRVGDHRAHDIVCNSAVMDVTELEGDTKINEASSTMIDKVCSQLAVRQ